MITRISTRDARYPIGSGHGSDAIHKDPVYSYAVTILTDDKGRAGSGLAFTLGKVIAAHVIARPHPELVALLPN